MLQSACAFCSTSSSTNIQNNHHNNIDTRSNQETPIQAEVIADKGSVVLNRVQSEQGTMTSPMASSPAGWNTGSCLCASQSALICFKLLTSSFAFRVKDSSSSRQAMIHHHTSRFLPVVASRSYFHASGFGGRTSALKAISRRAPRAILEGIEVRG